MYRISAEFTAAEYRDPLLIEGGGECSGQRGVAKRELQLMSQSLRLGALTREQEA